MNGRALLFDVGNTRLKWGLCEHGEIVRTGSVRHETLHDTGFSSLTTRLPRTVDQVLVCNVAGPGFAARLSSVLGIHCGAELHFARSGKAAHGVTNSYRQPRRLGVDRWVALIGARSESRTALCVVDAGTAVTIDALDKHGQHLGGQIIPGLHLMSRALETDTSDIGGTGKIGKAPERGCGLFANTTRQAVQFGSLSAVCGAIERAARAMRAAGHRPKIVLTGGDASRILKQLDGKALHRPNLVLQGLAIMLKDNP